MLTPPRRRWFQFSLRMLFVVVSMAAIVMGWFAYHWRWIAERERARQWLEVRGGFILYEGQSFVIQGDDGAIVQSLDGGITSRDGQLLILPTALWSLRILGEKTAHFVILSDSDWRPPLDAGEVEDKLPELRRLFPESDIRINRRQRGEHNNISPGTNRR